MRKITPLLAILFFLLFNCSSDDDNASNNSNIQINPPNWIQGKWLLEDSSLGEMGWEFTSNDLIIINMSNEISHRGQLQFYIDAEQEVSTQEEITSNTYKLTSNYTAGQTTVYSFTKISETEISWDIIENSTYEKQ
ncbi:hypothetical protein ES676_10505 [Bizionia saleffrena]|uniref:Lipocalin family protein n=1 Tax=Bizionia saleffrena TaxID=291189 RepID=A0A8H2LDU7_9FLAO|nr:hypothetical protein [Bizionia saleffrena]TYB72598.1 hypothetical protein ES676_10505 [Bizionia saleffrena]